MWVINAPNNRVVPKYVVSICLMNEMAIKAKSMGTRVSTVYVQSA